MDAPGHLSSLTRLEGYLAGVLPGFQGPLHIERLEGGQSNPTWVLQTPAASYVMRSKPAAVAQLLPSAHAIEREYTVMMALAGTQVPVPRMLHLCTDESVTGRMFYIMSHVSGRVLWDPALPGLTPAQRQAIYQETARVLAALHKVDVAGAGLASYGRAGNYFERQIDRWSRQYRASITQPIPAMDALMEWLPGHVPAQADAVSNTVVHGDYRLDNLIFHPTQPRVLAVLDWELSTLGHPLADLSYYCMAWHIPPSVFRGMGGMDLASLGIPPEAEFIACYCAHSSQFDPSEVQRHWPFYLAYNLFRMAAILQGIGKRLEQGIASSANAPELAAGARSLAELAWSFARKYAPQ
jgi:aminoglycoside phosphotransferase (APT) family kinase protein